MRHLWIAAVATMLGCSAAFAQMGPSVPTPGIAATSPLGMSLGSQVGTRVGSTGIPLGATEIASPGISPMITDPTAAYSGVACPVAGGASTGISGIMATSPTEAQKREREPHCPAA